MMNETELWYKTIFNNSRDAIFITKFSKSGLGKFIDVNKEACRKLGYTKKELLQLTPKDILFSFNGKNELNFSAEALRKFIAKKQYVFESVQVTKKGKKIPVELNTFIVKINGGFVVIVIAHDITKFKQNELRLKKLEKTYENFIDKTFDGIYKTKLLKPISIKQTVDKQVKAIYNSTVITECNKKYANMYGYSSENKMVGKTLKELYGNKLNAANYKVNKKFIENDYSLDNFITEEKDFKGNLKYFSNNTVGIIENGLLIGTWGTQSDITESVQITNELKLREEKFRTIFEQSPLGLTHYNKKGEIIEVNETFIKMMGSSREKLMGFNALKYAGNKGTRDAIKDMLTKGFGFFQGEYLSATGGKRTVVKAWFKGLKNGKGEIIGGTSIVEDISQQVENEEKLKLSEERFRTIFEQSPLSLLLLNKKGEIVEINKRFEQLAGVSRKKIIGFNSLERGGNKALRDAVKTMLTKGSAFYKGVYKPTIGKKNIAAKIWLKSIRNEKNKIIGGFSIIEDITIQIENEKKLELSEEKFRSIFEQSPLGLLFFNEKGEIVETNDRFIEIMGSSREKLVGFNSLNNAGDRKMRNAVKDMLTKGSAFYHGFYKSATGNKDVYVKAWFKGIRDKKGKIIGGTSITEDITRQVENEKKLHLSEEKYRAIFNSINEGIFIYELNTGKLVDVNQKTVEMYGFTYDELLNGSLEKLHADNKLYTTKEAYAYMRKAEKKPQFFEWRTINKDKNFFWVEVNMRLGKVSGIKRIIVTVRNITKRKEAEQELKSSEARYRQLINALPEPIIVHVAGKFAFVNEAAVKLAGVKKQSDLIGKSLLEFVHPDYRGFAMKRMLNSGNILPVVEEKFIKIDGTPLDVEVSGSRLFFNGKPAIQLIVRDITERKHIERIQKSLFKISQAAINAINLDQFFKEIHFIIKDLMPADNLYIALYNKESETLSFPYFMDEYDDLSQFDLTNVDIGQGYTAYVLRRGKSLIINQKMEQKLVKTGKIKPVGSASKIWVGIPLKYHGEIIGVLAVQHYHNENAYGENEKQILTFVSEQIAHAIVKIRTDEMNIKYMKELETAKNEIEYAARQLQEVNNELRLSEQKLKKTNINKDKFFSILSHDLRSPFTALLGYTQLLEEAYEDLSEEERVLSISSLNKTARNIFELLTGLLEWSRTQTGRMEYVPEKLNLHNIAEETIAILQMNANSKKINLINKINVRSFAVADKNMVRTIIRNLLSNALKFTFENGKVEISAKTVKNFMQITISDSGVGMTQSDIDRLFKIEEHYTTLGTNHEVGTGVGLILCKELVEKNGGKIWIESKVNAGSKFIFTLKKN